MQKSRSTVSILLPVYNADEYILDCMESILCQTHEDYELIIINDGSTDTSAQKILSFSDSRIRYHEHQGNQGLIKTLNKGLHYAEGEYIVRIDADDMCETTRIARQLEYLHANRVDIVGSNAYLLGGKAVLEKPITFEEIKLNLLVDNCMIHSSIMLRKKSLTSNSLYYAREALYAEDYKLWVDGVVNGLVIENMDECLIHYRVHDNQISSAKNNLQRITAHHIRLSYACYFFADIIAGNERIYLQLLFPQQGLLLERKETIAAIFSMAKSLMDSNKREAFFNPGLFDDFMNARLAFIENLLR